MYRSPDGHSWHLLHTDGQGGGILKPRGGWGYIIYGVQRTPLEFFPGLMGKCGQSEKSLL